MFHKDFKSRIDELSNPENYTGSFDITHHSSSNLLEELRKMVLIRYVEEIIGNAIVSGDIKCPCHLGIGQEAIAVGLSHFLIKTDRVFGGHRSHTHYLALGATPYSLFAEVLGKVSGCSKGMGGSMHLVDHSLGFGGSVPIVGGSVPIAVGAALAAKKDGKGDIAVAYLGDSACEEGAVQESFNLAKVMGLPMIFVVENNLFASHMHIDLRQPSNTVSRYAVANHIPYKTVDGNNISEVMTVGREAVSRSRKGEGPFFIEAVTYRWRGHVGAREDIDVGVSRNNDLKRWKKRDPIKRLADSMIAKKYIDQHSLEAMYMEVKEAIDKDWKKALKSDYPEEKSLFEHLYKR